MHASPSVLLSVCVSVSRTEKISLKFDIEYFHENLENPVLVKIEKIIRRFT
jgi:hypothetical protein